MPKRITQEPGCRRKTFIKNWREHRGLSQDRLVDRVRERVETFSKSSLSRIENGKQPYTQETLEVIAWALDCEPADLIMRDPENDIWTIMDTLKQLPPDERKQVARIVETFKKSA